MPERTDQAWIRLLKQDDPQAIEDLWILICTYATKTIKSNAKYRLYGSTDDQAEQIREVTLTVYERLRKRGIYQFRFNCDFKGYCRIIVVREAQRLGKQYRDQENRRQAEVDLFEESVGQDDINIQPSSKIIRAKLQPCLDELDSRRREIIERLYFKFEKPSDVAGQMGLTRNNVNQLAKRARASLLQCLMALGYHSSDDFA